MRDADTIVALASAPGRSAIAVLRLSGRQTRFALETIAGTLPEPRRASLRRLHDPADSELIDEGLVLWFPGPGSFTGEDCAELQVHGGRAVVRRMLEALCRLDGLRLAEPGEFSRRALRNGRFDLAGAEGLADLIDSETELQRKQALAQKDGVLGRACEEWRSRLLDCMALVEADIDFADEGDVGTGIVAQARALAVALGQEIEIALQGALHGERVREGFRVAILGAPNVGKSSLLNVLAGREIAIVAEVAGTTRDAIEVPLDLDGLPVILIDTAGQRETDDPVERIGIERAQMAAGQADLRLWLSPAQSQIDSPPEQSSLAEIMVGTKADLGEADGSRFDHLISAHTQLGIDGLLSDIRNRLMDRAPSTVLVTRERQRQCLQGALEALQRIEAGHESLPVEILAEELRLAAWQFGRITGMVDVEDVLDRVFSSFCIGK